MNRRRLSWLRWIQRHPDTCNCQSCISRDVRKATRGYRSCDNRGCEPLGQPLSDRETLAWLTIKTHWGRTVPEPPVARKRAGGTP